MCAGAVIVALIATFLLRFHLERENRRREHLSLDEYKREAAIQEACDWVR